MFILWWIAFGFMIFTILFAAFKMQQNSGASRLNDAYIKVGRGSFIDGYKYLFFWIVWLVILLGACVGAYYSYVQATKEKDINPKPFVEQRLPEAKQENQSTASPVQLQEKNEDSGKPSDANSQLDTSKRD